VGAAVSVSLEARDPQGFGVLKPSASAGQPPDQRSSADFSGGLTATGDRLPCVSTVILTSMSLCPAISRTA
jgi:hypothetical protein